MRFVKHYSSSIYALIAVWVITTTARAECVYEWLPGQERTGVDGPVCAMTTWDPDGAGPKPELMVIGGSFTQAGGVQCGNIAAWDGWQWLRLGTGVSGTVRALVVHDGQLVAGGDFGYAGGVRCNCIARWDGHEWQGVGAGFGGLGGGWGVHALAVYENQLVAGGHFFVWSEEGDYWDETCPSIARWDGSQWQPMGMGIGERGNPGYVFALAVYDGELVAGGRFKTAGGVACNNITRWDGRQWQPIGARSGITGTVHSLAVYHGQLLAGGDFIRSCEWPHICAFIACWDGEKWQSIAPENDGPGPVYALTVHGGDLVVGGRFTIADGACSNIASWDGQQWLPLGSGTDQAVYTLASCNGRLVAGGEFTTAGDSECAYIAGWDNQEWLPVGGAGIWGGDPAANVYALAVYDEELIAGGLFTTAGGASCDNIARWDGRRWRPLGTTNYIVKALAVYQGELVAGGSFTVAGGVPCAYIARWNGQEWLPLGSGLAGGSYTSVNALTVYNGELIVGGHFVTAGGVFCNHIARWNGQEWLQAGVGFNEVVYALAVHEGRLFAAGAFVNAGTVPCSKIAQWEGGYQWQPLGTGMNANVRTLAVHQGQLVAGGGFVTAGGVACNRIARWDGTAWWPLGSGMNSPVWTLAIHGKELIAGGYFTASGAVSLNRMARWDGCEWLPVGTGTNGPVYALAPYDDQLIVAGAFSIAGEHPSASWARWGPAVPTTSIVAWRSVRDYGAGGGAYGVVLDPHATTGNRIVTEPRRGGIRRIEVDIIGPADGSLALADVIEAAEIGGAGFVHPADQQQIVHLGGEAYMLIAEWSGGLPDGRCYHIDLRGCVPCLGGDGDCMVRALAGDLNNDGRTDSTDMMLSKGQNGSALGADTARFDVNLDGRINLADMATVKLLTGQVATGP